MYQEFGRSQHESSDSVHVDWACGTMARLFKPLSKVRIKHFPWLIGFLLLVVIVFASFRAPTITQFDPAQKQSKVTFNAPFTIHFSHIMDRSSVEDAFQLLPRTEGEFKWKDFKTLEFHPDELLTIGDEYRIVIKGSARSVWFKEMGFDTVINYLVTGPPYILFANPQSDSILAKDDVITVMFDRSIDWDGVNDGKLLQIEPDMDGEIRTMGLSAFQFIPKKVSSGETYTFTVPAGVPARDGGVTEEDFSWSVDTPSLKVRETEPRNEAENVLLDASLQILFDDEVSLDGIKPGVNALLYPSNDLDAGTDRKLDGFFNTEVTYGVDEDETVRKDVLVFEPTFPYQPDETYRFLLKSDADLGLEEDFELVFETLRTTPEEASTEQEIVTEASDPFSWKTPGMDFFVRGQNPRLELTEPLKAAAELVACPVPSNQFMRISAKQGWNSFDCENDGVTLDPTKKDLDATINLNDYFSLDWVTGVYFARLSQGEKTIYRHFLVEDSTMMLKRSENDLLVWALDVKSGDPISSMSLEVLNFEGEEILSGKTDESGVFSTNQSFDEGIYVRGKKEEEDISRWAFVSDQWSLGNADPYVSEPSGFYVWLNQHIFSPGDSIGIKGIWRQIQNNTLALPGATQVTITIEDTKQNFIVSKRVPMRRNGSFDTSILLPEEVGSGNYLLSVADLNHQRLSEPVPIQIRDESDLKLEWLEAKESHPSGEAPVYIVKARYKNGIPAANVAGHFELFRQPKTIKYEEGAVSYSFNRLGSECAENCRKRTLVTSETFEFDLNGEAKLVLTGENKSFLLPDHEYSLQVTAATSDESLASINQSFQIHQGTFDLGLGLKHALISGGNPIEANILSLDHARNPVDNKRVRLSLISDGAKPKTVYEDDFDSERTVKKINIPLSAQIKDGIYTLRAESRDEKNNEILAEQKVYVGTNASEAISNELLLAADQSKYFVGGRAHLVVNEPEASEEKPVPVIVTYERDGLLGSEALLLKSPLTRINVPIRADMVPQFVVNVTRFHRGLTPSFSTASEQIEVGSDEAEVLVDISFEPENPGPGEEVTARIYTYDYQNRALPAALTLNLTDQLPEVSNFSHQHFYSMQRRPLSSASNITLGSKNLAPDYSLPDEHYLLNSLRSVHFEPLLATGENGETTIKFTLPEGRQDLYLTALATRDTQQFGTGHATLKMNQELDIEPILPSFAIPGDQTVFAASVTNISGEAIQTRLELVASDTATKGADSARSISLQPGQQAEVTFNVFVDKDTDNDFLTVEFRSEKDSIETELPLKHLKASTRVINMGMLGDIWTGRVHLPKEAHPGLGQISLTMSGSPLTTAQIQSEALAQHRYDSTYLLAANLLSKISTLSKPLDEKDLGSVRGMISSLLKRADENGAYRFWSESDPSPRLTALALLSYLEAGRLGVHVDSLQINKTTENLWKQLDRETLNSEDTLFALWVLSRNEQYDTERTISLFQDSDMLSPQAKAYMLMTLDELVKAGQGSVSALFDALEAALVDEAVQSEDLVYFDGPAKVTAIVLYALGELDSSNPILGRMANYLASSGDDLINELDPEAALWTIMALNKYSGYADLSDVNYIVQAKINGALVLDQSVATNTATEIHQSRLDADILNTDDINDVFVKKDGVGPLYLDLHLTSHLIPDQVTRRENGLLIIRNLYEIDEEGKRFPVQTYRRGKRYLSELEIVVPRDYEYVALSDAIPAGMKAHSHKQNLSQPFTQMQLEDDRVTYYATSLPAGVYRIETELQAILPGSYYHLPAFIQAIFEPSLLGQTEGGILQIID